MNLISSIISPNILGYIVQSKINIRHKATFINVNLLLILLFSITMLINERGLTFDSKQNLALIYDTEDDIVEVFEIKEKLMKEYNVSLFKRAKNMKNFYDKITEVANFVTSVKDYKENKPIKNLAE